MNIEIIAKGFGLSLAQLFFEDLVAPFDVYLAEFERRFNNRDNPYLFRDTLKTLISRGAIPLKELVA